MIRSFLECFFVAFRLGLLCFGGPVAHLGYFQREYVEKRRWLSPETYAELMAICQLLPGPTSSQLGAAIGAERGGLAGAIGAWLGFTLPSALLLIAFALGLQSLNVSWVGGMIEGLTVAAVAVVSLALFQMTKSLCPDGMTRILAILGLGLMLLFPYALTQVAVIVIGALGGIAMSSAKGATELKERRSSKVTSLIALLAFAVATVFFLRGDNRVLSALYEAGALVFGGGHVVLPLLEESLVNPGLIDRDSFFAGYGAAQAVPGPLFTFGAYLGAVTGGWMMGVIATGVIFLPGLLLLAAVYPQRAWLKRQRWAPKAVAGAAASVVGLLAYALWGMFLGGEVAGLWQWLAYAVAISVLYKKFLPTWGIVIALGTFGALI